MERALTSANNHITAAPFTYDGDGHRVQKSNGKLYWYGGGEVIEESDASGNMQQSYVFFDGKRIANRVVSSGAISFYAEDFIGSSRVITTSAGATCYDADFYPYGAESNVTNACAQNYKWTGKERDAETDNDDFDARYYSSTYGRFLSADWSAVPAPVPYANLTNPQTLNLYAIVRDNPESYADLDGHCWNWAEKLCNYWNLGLWDTNAQVETIVATEREWLKNNIVSINGNKPDFGKLSNSEVLKEYDFVQGAIEQGRYSVEGQPPNIPGTPVGNVPDVDWGAQEKHFEGHNSYRPGRSTLTANPEELAAKAGTGTPVNNVPRGEPGYKERVDFGKVIGNYVDESTGASMPTTKGIIHYSKDGIHIVPARP